MAYTEQKYLPVYFTLCTGILSHLLLFICLIKDPLKCFRNSATYLIMNLALSDCIVCTLGLMQMIFADADELLTVGYVSNTAILVSLFSIFSIAIDRYVLTVHPLKHRLFLNGKKIAIWIVSVWLLGFYQLVKILIFGSDQKEDRLIFVTVFLTFSLVTFFIYILIYFTLKRREREISQQQSQSGNRVLQEAFLKTIMIVAFAQIVTLVPVCITELVGNHVAWSLIR